MIPDRDMPAERDREAVQQLVNEICRMPGMDPRAPGALGSRPTIRGGTFSAFLGLDLRRAEDVGMNVQMHVRFAEADCPRIDRSHSWAAWVRCDGPGVRDRLPEEGSLRQGLRKAFKPSRLAAWEQQGGKAASISRTAHWWVSSAHHAQDIKAQVWLFLLRAGLVGEGTQGLAHSELWNYLEDCIKATPDESPMLLEKLKNNFCRPERGAAWPAFVRRWLHFIRRTARPVEQRARRQDGNLSLEQAAQEVGMPVSTLYDRVKRGELKIQRDGRVEDGSPKRQMLMGPVELEQLRADLGARFRPAARIKVRQEIHGGTYDAARKWVARQRRLVLGFQQIGAMLAETRRGGGDSERRASSQAGT